MRNLDILAAENGEHVRVLLCGEEQSYVVLIQNENRVRLGRNGLQFCK